MDIGLFLSVLVSGFMGWVGDDGLVEQKLQGGGRCLYVSLVLLLALFIVVTIGQHNRIILSGGIKFLASFWYCKESWFQYSHEIKRHKICDFKITIVQLLHDMWCCRLVICVLCIMWKTFALKMLKIS